MSDYDSPEEIARAAAKASQTASASAEERYRPQLVRTAFATYLGPQVSEEQLDAFLEQTDPDRYLSEDGTVDVERVISRARELVGPSASRGPRLAAAPAGDRTRHPDLYDRIHHPEKASAGPSLEAGSALWDRLHPKPGGAA